ncbi:MAG: DNA-3-methyladenine glycosylase [Thermoplasmata archaeon]|nr:DNA-3-methyladenine glycosylase [Thermoplasmata archaeon]
MHRLSKANPLPAEQAIPGDDGFAALVTSIVHQQVSLAAGRTITANLVKTLGGKVTPRRVLNRDALELRQAGLSRAKAAYILDLAQRTQSKEVDFAAFSAMADDAVADSLVAVKGIGVWTAKMFLMFHLQRPDVLAPEDLGLRLAVANTYGVAPEDAAAFMREQGPAWSPYCSVAARVLWQSRR